MPGREPDSAEIARRRVEYFEPYHVAIDGQLQRLRAKHPRVVLFDAHSIRSRVARLFDGELPQFNLGTNSGASCDAGLTSRIEDICARTHFDHVTNGRFRGGWITRHYGKPENGIHAVQLELAMRGYLHEPEGPLTEANWPAPLDDVHAAMLRVALRDILDTCIQFAAGSSP